MSNLTAFFDDRVKEVETYLELLFALERQAQEGPPSLLMNSGNYQISTEQQKILYSSVYMLLYNLVESTVSICIDKVAEVSEGRMPIHLRKELQREWIKNVVRTHVDLTPEHRLDSTCDFFLKTAVPIEPFSIERGGGGNWDDNAIEQIGKRIGLKIKVESEIYELIKRKFRDDLGPLAVVKELRNKLAHGSISFTECADGVTVAQLNDISMITISYLRGVMSCFIEYVDNLHFLKAQYRTA